MKTSQRLAPVLKLEELKEQAAVKSFGDARSQVAVEMEKLQQLLDYTKEYENMITAEGRTGITAARLQSYHKFLNRLSHAVSQQEEQVELARQQEAQAEQAWFQQRGAVKSMDSLIARNQQLERQEEDKREQRDSDELANQARAIF